MSGRIPNKLYDKNATKSVHKIGKGVVRKVWLKDIKSPQAGVHGESVKRLSKTDTGKLPEIEHRGHGRYVVHDGNHRLNAEIMKGKRKVEVKVQRFGSQSPVIHFTSIAATKRLIKTLRSGGVKIVRENTAKGAEYQPGIEQMFRRGLMPEKPSREMISALPPTIKVSRDKALLGKTAMGPREALRHESGHHASQAADAIHQRKANVKAVADAEGLDIHGQMNVGAEMMRDVTLRKEYRANRAAAKLIGRMGATDRIPIYRKTARRQEAGYEKIYEKGAMAAALGMSIKGDTIRLDMNAIKKLDDKLRQKEAGGVSAHDVATGAIEGGLGVVATDKLIHRFVPSAGGLGRKLAIGVGVGAGMTGLVGYGLNRINRKSQTDLSRLKGRTTIMLRGKYHEAFAEDSPLHTSPQGRDVFKAVNTTVAPKLVIPRRDDSGIPHKVIAEADGGEFVRKTGKPSYQQQIDRRIGAYEGAVVNNQLRSSPHLAERKAASNAGIKSKYGASGGSIARADAKAIEERERYAVRSDLRGKLSAGQLAPGERRNDRVRRVLSGQIKNVRGYAARELVESRKIIHGYAKANSLKVGDVYGHFRNNPGEIGKIRSKLNDAAGVMQIKGKGRLDRYRSAVKSRMEENLGREFDRNNTPKLGQIDAHQSARRSFVEDASTKMIGTLDQQHAIETPGKLARQGIAPYITKNGARPTMRDQLKVVGISKRFENLENKAVGGDFGVASRKAEAIKRPEIFRPASEAKSITKPGYPHLKKIGIAIAGAGLATAGISAIRKKINRDQPVALRSRLMVIKLGLKLTGKGKTLANQKVFKRLHDAGYIEYTQEGGGSWKQRYEKSVADHTDTVRKHRIEAEAAARHKPKDSTGRQLHKARTEGHVAGYESASDVLGARYEDKVSQLNQEASALRDDLSKRKMQGARSIIVGASAASAAGIGGYAIGRKKNETQLAARDDQDGMAGASLHAGMTAGISGTVIGGVVAALRRGSSGAKVLKSALGAGAVSAGLAGAGTYIGGKILGAPKRDEGAAITKRAGIGGAILGTGIGTAAVIAARRGRPLPIIGGLESAARKWRPAHFIKTSSLPKAIAAGAATGGLAIGAHTAYEGQDVDTVRAVSKKKLSSKTTAIQLQVNERTIASDKYKKKIKESERDRRDASYGRGALIGGALAAQHRGPLKMPIGRAFLAGAGAGIATQAIVRSANSGNKDRFGEKTISAKRTEALPAALGGAAIIGVGAKRLYETSPKLRQAIKTYFSSRASTISLDAADQIEDQRRARRWIYGSRKRTYPAAQEFYRNAKRAKNIVTDVVKGPQIDERGRVKTPEYKKPWVRNIAGALVVGGLAVGGVKSAKKIYAEAAPHTGLGRIRIAHEAGGLHQVVRDIIPGGKKVSDFIKGAKEEVLRAADPAISKVADKVEGSMKHELIPVTADQKKTAAEKLKVSEAASRTLADIAEGKKKFPILNPKKPGTMLSSKLKPIKLDTQPTYVQDHIRGRRKQHPWEGKDTLRVALGGTLLASPFIIRGAMKRGAGIAAAEKEVQAITRRQIINEETAKAENEIRRRGVRKIVAHDFGPSPDIRASSKLRPIRLESRRDPEERLRDKLSVAKSVTGIASNAAIGAGVLYGGHRVAKAVPGLARRGRAVLRTWERAGKHTAQAGRAIESLDKKTDRMADTFEEGAKNISTMKDALAERMANRGPISKFFFSSRQRIMKFEERDHSKKAAAGAGIIGAVAGSQYIGGRAMKPGEDVTGKILVRRHKAFPLAHHEGIGVGGGDVAEVQYNGIHGVGKIGTVKADEFGYGKNIHVIDSEANHDAVKEAKSRLGHDYHYNILGNNCQDFTDSVRGVKKGVVSRQWRRAGAGLVAGAAIGYGAAKLIQRRKQDSSIKLSEKKKQRSTMQKIGIAAGVGSAALGASFLPGASKLIKIQAREIARGTAGKLAKVKGIRSVVKSPEVDPNRGGRMVADYIDASHSLLNTGITGKVVGKSLEHARANPHGPVAKAIGKIPGSNGPAGADFAISHYQHFRGGHRTALNHWDWEVGELFKHRGRPAVNAATGRAKPGMSKKRVDEELTGLHIGREKTNAAIDHQIHNVGKSESEAIRHVATKSEDPDVRGYFDKLAMTKAGAAKGYAKKALVAPGLVIGGGALAAGANASGAQDRRTRRMSVIPKRIIRG